MFSNNTYIACVVMTTMKSGLPDTGQDKGNTDAAD